MRVRLQVGAFLLLLVVATIAAEQGRNRWEPELEFATDNVEYNGRFTFARIRYGSGRFWNGASWAHDYPRADRHLPRILTDITTADATLEGSNVFDLDDDQIFEHPLIYLSEPGFWRITESEAANLRRYLLKGGFIIFDDFEAEQWYNFEAQVRRALPEYRMIQIDVTHPIFHSFFEMKTIDFPHPLVNVMPRYYGVFEDNDPTKRMMAMVNYNADLAEYWEWSDTGMFPVNFTSEAYKLGVNYLVYAMTH
jgi:hypothetical protein